MSFDQKEFKELCQQASTTLTFEESIDKLHLAISAVEGAADLAPFHRSRLVNQGQQALELIEQRRTDPTQFLGALNDYLSTNEYNAAVHAALDDWFIDIAYKPEAAVTADTIDKVRVFRLRNPKFKLVEKLQDVEKRLMSLERFAHSSVDLEETLRSVTGLERVLLSLPTPPNNNTDLLDRITEAKRLALERNGQPLEKLLDEGFTAYEQIIQHSGRSRLDQETSKELQLNIFGGRRVLERVQLAESSTQNFVDRLDRIEEKFDDIRFLSSSAIFKRVFEPHLSRVKDEVDNTVDFPGMFDELKEIQERSRSGRIEGLDLLKYHHQQRVRALVDEVRQKLNERYSNIDALRREVRLANEQVSDLDRKPVLMRHSIIRAQKYLKHCITWARKVDSAETQILESLIDKCNTLWESVETRYVTYVQGFSNSLTSFESVIGGITDFGSAYEELQDIRQSITDRDNGLKRADGQHLLDRYDVVQRRFYQRLNDVAEIKSGFMGLDQKLTHAARYMKRYSDFDALEAEARALGFRVSKGRFNSSDERELVSQIRKVYARIKGLKRKREQYLAERTANQEALFTELMETVSDCQKAAKERPGDPGSWEMLLDADRQLRAERILTKEQHDSLHRCLDEAFACIKEERAKFARMASLVYGQYLDAIQNIFQPLERTSPRPSREDAFEAIEAVKPLRTRLREEQRLLRSQRQELSSNLRMISDAISEILDRASAEMQRNLIPMRRRLEDLRQSIQEVQQTEDLAQVIVSHKALYADLKTSQLSVDGRKECRSALEDLWEEIKEKQQEFGRSRFDAGRIDTTLARLENLGHFLWMRQVPNIG